MKNTMMKMNQKGRRMDISAALPSTAHGIAGETEMAEWQGPVACVNLRPGRESGRLVPVEDFEDLANVGSGSEPILCWQHTDRGECVLVRAGNSLIVVTGTAGNKEAVECHDVGVMPSAPLCAIAEGEGKRVTVMTAGSAYYLTADDETGLWRIDDARPEFPAATFTAASYSTLTADVGEKVLKGVYGSAIHRLDKNDCDALRDDLTGAMEEIECVARAAGRSTAPLLMRYRLRDETGQTLFLSPVVLTGTDKGYQWSGELSTATSTTGGSMKRDGFTVEAESFVPRLRLPVTVEEGASRLVKTLEVEAVGPLNGADSDGIVWNRLDVVNNRLRFHIPGMAATMATDTARLKGLILGALVRFEELSEKVASVSEPFSAANRGREIEIDVPGGGMSGGECQAKLHRALSKPPRTRGVHEKLLAGGGWTAASFTAETATCNGDTTLWGNLAAAAFEGWGAGHFATKGDAAKSWTGTASVERGTGRATCNSGGYDHAPNQLSPLIVWPGEDGGMMTLKVKTSAGTAIERFDLTPIAGSGLSVWLSPTLQPTALDYSADNMFSVSASTVERMKMPGTIAGAAASRSLEPQGVMTAPGSSIAGMTPATALSSAWDFSRDRFYIMGDGGINLCVTNARHEPVAVQLIDRRKVESYLHIAPGTADRGVAVIAEGRAVNVKGSKATDFPGLTPDECCGIGWNGGDLWIMLTDGKAQVRPAEAPDRFYLRDTPPVGAALSCGDGVLRMTDKAGVLRDSRHTAHSDKDVEWSYRVELPGYVPTPTRGAIGSVLRITAIGLAMVASAVKARLTATTDGGSASITLVRLLLSAMISGTMKESLFLPVRAGRRHWFTIGLKGSVSADMRLSGVSLHMG